MDYFNQERFNRFILDNDIVCFSDEPIQLKSGRTSNWYVNWRTVAEDVFLLDELTNYIIEFTQNLRLEPNCFYGVPEGATKLGIITQYKWARKQPNYKRNSHTLPMGRGKPKDHGAAKYKYSLGEPRGRTILLEDVTTTGDSLLTTIDSLIEAEVPIIAAFGLTDRMVLRYDRQSVKDAVEFKGVPYFSLSNALQLLPEAYKRLNPGEEIARAIEEEFENYGVEKLKLRHK